MIFFDVTKAGAAGHRSGLMRVSARLADGLGSAAAEVRWPAWDRSAGADDWFLTGELFSEDERPGFTEYLAAHPCRLATIFHDAIPLQYPHITWPQSVARHPGYMKLLSRFDRVWAVSAASRHDLVEFWRWQSLAETPPVEVLALGADFSSAPRIVRCPPSTTPSASLPLLLCVGILEPRKNQAFLLDVCEELWREGLKFELRLVGRVNPHFGPPLVARIESLRKEFPGLRYHKAASDADVAKLYASARASVCPTIAEGCGLPLLESLWMGVPCVCSDLPVLRENADGGGCLPVAVNDRAAWKAALRGVLTDDILHTKLTTEATTRPLPTWNEAVQSIRRALQT
jgi:glycosyltransferase involved in cell wall biosynthesis